MEDYTIHTLLSLSIVFQEFFRISWPENPIKRRQKKKLLSYFTQVMDPNNRYN